MAQLSTPFDPRAHRPALAEGGAASLPVGKYPMQITASEFKETKNDRSQAYLELTLEVLDGPARGVQNAKWRFNLFNNSAQAVEIAYAQLTSLCYVCGWLQPLSDTSVLHGKPFVAVVTPQRNDPERTEISGCLTMDMQDPGKMVGAPASAPAPQAYAPPAAAAPAPAASWGGGAAAAAPAPAAAPAWGGGQPAATAPAPAAAPAWGGAAPGGAPAGGSAPPWGQR